MNAPRILARDLMSAAELAEVRTRSTWKGFALVLHAWALILGSIALVAAWPNPLTFLFAVAIIGSRQLGLAILMHDGAHGNLAKGERPNLWLSQWLCAYPVFAETRAYRRYHLQHHARTQQHDDPDLMLSAPFPITAPSYRRKFFRDILGRTGYAQRKAQVLNALGNGSWPLSKRARHFAEKLGPQIFVNAILFASLALAGVWWAYSFLWLLPLMTWMMVVTRIRNIAEHAVVPDSDDPLRNTRTTKAGFLERLFLAPYYVNYHLEHHLLFYVPCYNLPRVHEILGKDSSPTGWKCSRITKPCCAWRRRNLAIRMRRARSQATFVVPATVQRWTSIRRRQGSDARPVTPRDAGEGVIVRRSISV